MPPSYDNRSLFSDHYLATRLPQHGAWSEPVVEPLARARELYEAKRDSLPGLNEAQTEEELIKPILREVLGWSYDVQPKTRDRGRLHRPDYALFRTEEAKAAAAVDRSDESRYFSHASAVGDAKYWERPLDARGDEVPRQRS